MSRPTYVLQIHTGKEWEDLRANPMPGDKTSYDNVRDASLAAQRLAARGAHKIRVKRAVDGLIVDEYDTAGTRVTTFSD